MAKTKRSGEFKQNAPARKALTSKKSLASEHEAEGQIPIDRRTSSNRRAIQERRKKDAPVPVERRKLERRTKVSRRRQIDPTTCERDYSEEEVEFMGAMDDYKRSSGRMFPTCSEVLEVLRALGYEKRPKIEPTVELPAPIPAETPCSQTAV